MDCSYNLYINDIALPVQNDSQVVLAQPGHLLGLKKDEGEVLHAGFLCHMILLKVLCKQGKQKFPLYGTGVPN